MADRIALVDDDQNILTSVALALESEGFEVDSYNDGETALAGLSRRQVDLAVLDIKMPRMDGIELLQKIRNQSQMPVIFLTSKDDELEAFLKDDDDLFEMPSLFDKKEEGEEDIGLTKKSGYDFLANW